MDINIEVDMDIYVYVFFGNILLRLDCWLYYGYKV